MNEKNHDNFILQLKEEFKKTIPSDEQELADSFEKYMRIGLDAIKEYKYVKNDEESIKRYLRDMADSLKKLSLDAKKRELIPDENYEKISSISNEAFQLAQSLLLDERIAIDIDVEEKIRRLEDLLNFVEPYNKESAKQLVSEGILDLRFLLNPKDGITSLRLGRIIYKRREDNEEENTK